MVGTKLRQTNVALLILGTSTDLHFDGSYPEILSMTILLDILTYTIAQQYKSH